MYMHKFLWLLIVLVFSVVACDSSSSTPTLLPPPGPTSPPVEDTPTPGPLPDLTIQDVNIEPAPTVSADGRQFLLRGITYTFSVNVINIGEGPVRGVAVDAPYGCVGQGKAPNILFAGNDLARGDESRSSESFSLTIPTDSGGNCTFKFIVDPDNIYAESHESSSSNIREITFEVP